MKLDTILITDPETDEKVELEVGKYVKAIVKELDVPAFESEQAGSIPAEKVVQSIVKSASAGKEVSSELEESGDYTEVINRVESDVKATIAAVEDKKNSAEREKEEAKKKKEEEKAKKEKEAKEQLARQETFIAKVDEGSEKASKDFLSQLEGVKSNLPKSISIQQSGSGFGIALSDDASDADLGVAIGYFQGASQNSEAFQNQVQFFIGDLAAACVKKGLFNTALDASKAISAHLETQGKRIAPGAIDTYRRMSERTPIEMRNPKADPTAYLELSRTKRPKKGEKESTEDFKKREAKFEEEIAAIQEEIRDGKILTRKDALPKVQELKYAHGIEERPDPNKKTTSVSDMLRMFFLGKMAIEHLVGNYKDKDGNVVEDSAAFINPEDKSIVWVTETELETMVEEAQSNLMNVFMKSKHFEVKDLIKGYKVEKKMEAVGTDADGKALKEERSVHTPVYLPIFFDVETEESDTEEDAGDKKEEASAEEPKADKKKAKAKA